jgi:cell wall-associated NlpC family hydrolase
MKLFCVLFVLILTVSANDVDGDDRAVRFEKSNGTTADEAFGLLFDTLLGNGDRLLGFSKDQTVCTTGNLNIRAAPGTAADILFTATAGEELVVVSEQTWDQDGHTWNQVSGRSKTGYAASSFLSSCGNSVSGTVKGPCGTYSDIRTALVNAAWALYNQRAHETYSQAPNRWSGITKHVCPPSAPPTSDCSSSTTWAYWTVFGNGADFINGQRWSAGYTGTQISHGKETHSPQKGDLVFYGKSRSEISHVAMYIGNGQVISHGSDPVRLVDKNYRSDLQFIKS